MKNFSRDDRSPSPEQLRLEMKLVRSNLDRDIRNVVTEARALAHSLNFFGNHPWWSLGAAALTGYFLVPSKRRFLRLDPHQAAKLAKEHTVVVAEPEVRTSPWAGVANIATSALMRTALVFASRHLNQVIGRLATGSGSQVGPDRARASGSEGKWAGEVR